MLCRWFEMSLKAAVHVSDIHHVMCCIPYSPKGIQLDSIPELWCHLLYTQYGLRDELHPTLGAVKQLIHRVQILDTLWGQAFASLSKSSWICCNMDYTGTQHDQVKPITVEVLPAPKAIIEMVRCLVVQNRLFFFPMLLQIKELNTHRHRAISAAPSVRAMRTLERTCCQMKVMIDDF